MIGIDPMKYSGRIEPTHNGGFSFHVEYLITPGTPLITGGGTVATPTPVALDFNLPTNFAEGVVVGIQTPFGPFNAKISKLSEFNF